MTRSYLGKRLLWSIAVLIASTMVIFLLVGALGNPLTEMRLREPPVPEDVIEREAERLGLNKPLWERYLIWLAGILRGDFGPSINPTQDIAGEIGSRMVVSLQLVGWALLVAVVLTFLVGTFSAVFPKRPFDLTSTVASFIFIAFPSFWIAVLLKQFGIWVNTQAGQQVFYTLGPSSPVPPDGLGPRVMDILGHILLPTLTLAVVHFASWSRFHRAAVLDSISTDYVKSAVLRGLPFHKVVWHGVRPALIPIATVISLDLPVLFSGTVITELVFQWNGMGAYLKQSIEQNDMNALMAWMLIAATAVVVFNLLTDALYLWLDPRIRYDA